MELQNSTVPPPWQEKSTVPVGLKRSARVVDRLPHDTVSFSGLPVKPQQDNSLLARGVRAAQGVWDSIWDSSLPDPNQTDQWGDTALHKLLDCPNPDPAMVERLLKRGANPNLSNNDNNNALHIFAIGDNSNPQILDYLLPHIENINQKGMSGETALHKLLKQPDPDPLLVKQLLAWGADPNIPNNDKNNALHLFVEQKNPNPQVLDSLLPYIEDINQRGLYQQTALHKLFKMSDPHPLMVKQLLKKGADPNIQDSYTDSVLHLFAQKTKNPNPEILQALIQSGMDLNQKDVHKKPALFYLLKKDRPDIQTIRTLLDHGARLNEQYGVLYNRTPLHWVMEKPKPDPALIRLFLEKGADVHMEDGCGKTALEHYKKKFPGQSSSGVKLLEEHMEQVRQHTPSLRIEEIHDAPPEARMLQDVGCAVRPAEGAALKTTPQVLKQAGKSGAKTVWQSLMENIANFWKRLLGLLLCR